MKDEIVEKKIAEQLWIQQRFECSKCSLCDIFIDNKDNWSTMSVSKGIQEKYITKAKEFLSFIDAVEGLEDCKEGRVSKVDLEEL